MNRPPLLGLLLCAATACGSDASLGEYPDTDGATSGADASTGGADTSTDGDTDADTDACGEDCDADFAVAFVRGQNAEGVEVVRSGSELCTDASCPDALEVQDCLTSDDALASALGPDEYCRISATWLAIRFDISFTTPADRSSFELTRESLFEGAEEPEAYAWFPEVVELRGPGTAFRGDVSLGVVGPSGTGSIDVFSSVYNESCAQRLDALGISWEPGALESACMATWDDGGVIRPVRMQPEMTFRPTAGLTSSRTGWSEASADSGPDTACSACDLATGPLVARYGVDPNGERRRQADATSIACDPAEDVLVACADLRLDVTRPGDTPYRYAWDDAEQDWPLPLPDKLRETHPDRRPAGLVPTGPACDADADCLDSQRCYGRLPGGEACSSGPDCAERTCQPEWFGACDAVESGETYCVDRRFDPTSAGACWSSTDDASRLSSCDVGGDLGLDDAGCCDPDLGGVPGCDPFEQAALQPLPRYDREPDLAAEASCVCAETGSPSCADIVATWCAPPLGEGVVKADEYAFPWVTRNGGVRWDGEDETLAVGLANMGDLDRAMTEACAEVSFGSAIDSRSSANGWISHARRTPELAADHDLALCSGSTYELVFAESDQEHYVRSEAGGTLDERARFTLETPQFRVAQSGLQVLDADQVRSCSQFSLQLSNHFDIGPLNLRKIELHEGGSDGPVVAGGLGCTTEPSDGQIPCLTIGRGESFTGLHFEIDEDVHGQVLQPGSTYTVVLPGLESVDDIADSQAYAAAFHDACGMPLIVDALPPLSFTVDAACE